MMKKSVINGLALDVSSNSPVVVLSPEGDESLILPIWIGHFEAWAIAMELSGFSSKRPLTHDLMNRLIGELGGTVQRIEVTELVEQTFFARIIIERDDSVLEIDARPSDSLALALKAKVDIFVNEELFQQRPEGGEEEKKYDAEALKERLRNINPEDFGKYSL